MENDLISRSALLAREDLYIVIGAGDNICIDVADIAKAPAVDAVEVVRCKDCKHWKHFDHVGCSDFAKVCGLANYMVGATGYCIYGERRADDG